MKRVRLETAPPPPPVAPERAEHTEIPEADAKKCEPEPLSPKLEKTASTLSPPRSSEASSNFVFGEKLSERAAAPAPGFVFGQNLTERAENFSSDPKEPVSPAAAAAAAETKSEQPLPASSMSPVSDPKSPPKSLTESAAAYYESHATPKRKYDEARLFLHRCVRIVENSFCNVCLNQTRCSLLKIVNFV